MSLSQNQNYPTIQPHRIHLIGEGRMEEAVASVAVLPGMLVELNATGGVRPHTTAGGEAERCVALEDALQGNGIYDQYPVGQPVSYLVCERGAVVFMYLSAGQSVDETTFLQSNGDGTLTPYTSGKVIAKSLSTLSVASDTAKALIRVRMV